METHRHRHRYLLDLWMAVAIVGLRADRLIAVMVRRTAPSAVVAAEADSIVAEAGEVAVVLRFGEGCCRSSLIARHCLMAVGLRRGLGSHCDER